MSKTLKVSLLFGTTLVTWAIAVFLLFDSVAEVIRDQRALVTFEVPGSVSFPVAKPGTLTVWHDYRTTFDGATIRQDEDLPSGFQFRLNSDHGGSPSTMNPAGMRTTMQLGGVSKIAVGSFQVPEAGTYTLEVQGPEQDPRIVSVTAGSFGEAFRQVFSSIGMFFLLGVIGFVTLIVGIVSAVSRSTSPPPLP